MRASGELRCTRDLTPMYAAPQVLPAFGQGQACFNLCTASRGTRPPTRTGVSTCPRFRLRHPLPSWPCSLKRSHSSFRRRGCDIDHPSPVLTHHAVTSITAERTGTGEVGRSGCYKSFVGFEVLMYPAVEFNNLISPERVCNCTGAKVDACAISQALGVRIRESRPFLCFLIKTPGRHYIALASAPCVVPPMGFCVGTSSSQTTPNLGGRGAFLDGEVCSVA